MNTSEDREYVQPSAAGYSAARSRKRISIVLLLVIGLLGTGCQTVTDWFAPVPEDLIIHLVVTHGLEGDFFPYQSYTEMSAEAGIDAANSSGAAARLKSFIDSRNDGYTVLMDIGNFMGNDILNYYYNHELLQEQHIQTVLMNYLGYDAAVPGSDVYRQGETAAAKIRDNSEAAVLASNFIRSSSGEPFFADYIIIQYGGIRIAAVGFVTPNVLLSAPDILWGGIEAEPIAAAAEKRISRIREEEQPDLLVGLFNQQVSPTADMVDIPSSASAESDRQASLSRTEAMTLVPYLNQFDIAVTSSPEAAAVFAERSAEPAERPLILGPSDSSRHVSAADIVLSWNKRTGKYEPGRIQDVSEETAAAAAAVPADELFIQEMKTRLQPFFRFLQQPLGRSEMELSTEDAYWGDSHTVDMIHGIQKQITGADITLAPVPAFDAGIQSGELKPDDLFSFPLLDYYVYSYTMTGKEIRNILEYAYAGWYNQMNGPRDHLLLFNSEFTGESGNEAEKAGANGWEDHAGPYAVSFQYPFQNPYSRFITAEGLQYTVDAARAPGSRIRIAEFSDGRPFREDQFYVTAVPSYLTNGESGHLAYAGLDDHEELKSREIAVTSRTLRYYLINSIRSDGVLRPVSSSNWHIVPEAWAAAGRMNDEELLGW